MGTRFSVTTGTFTITQEAQDEDKQLRKSAKETNNQRMKRICLPGINNVNKDLVFTAEIREDFPDSKLPTLDFLLWLSEQGMLIHSYFEKLMKTPYVLMCRSAMSEHQKYSILSNEVITRLSNIDHQNVGRSEVEEILENMIVQMKTSGYNRKETREAIVSGVLGWKRKIERRKKGQTSIGVPHQL